MNPHMNQFAQHADSSVFSVFPWVIGFFLQSFVFIVSKKGRLVKRTPEPEKEIPGEGIPRKLHLYHLRMYQKVNILCTGVWQKKCLGLSSPGSSVLLIV